MRKAPVGALAIAARDDLAGALRSVAGAWTSFARAVPSGNVGGARSAVARARARVNIGAGRARGGRIPGAGRLIEMRTGVIAGVAVLVAAVLGFVLGGAIGGGGGDGLAGSAKPVDAAGKAVPAAVLGPSGAGCEGAVRRRGQRERLGHRRRSSAGSGRAASGASGGSTGSGANPPPPPPPPPPAGNPPPPPPPPPPGSGTIIEE